MARVTNRILLGAVTITLVFGVIVFGTPGIPGLKSADVSTNTANAQEVDQQATVLLDQIEELYPAFGKELKKLPETKNSPNMKSLADIKTLVQNLTPQQREAIEEMFKVGKPEARKFLTPIQALYWVIDVRGLDKSQAILSKGWKKVVKNAWGNMKGERWDEFDEVADRVNNPELLDYYIDHNFKKIVMPESKSHNVYDVFVRKEGWCGELAMFGIRVLKQNGYDADIYWDMAWPKPMYGQRGRSGHTIAAYRNGDLMCVFIDFTMHGNYFHDCMDKQKWVTGDENLFENKRIRKQKMQFDTRYILRTEPLPGWWIEK